MKYSFNRDREGIIFANEKEINASFKDLISVCDAIRYRKVEKAQMILESVITGGMPIEFRKYNKGMGSRHELKGRKGRYPIKCAKIVKKVLVNASANAKNNGYLPELMFVVHAAANKTQIIPRLPSKGAMVVRGNHSMGSVSYRHSNIELAKVEIGLAKGDERGIGKNMKIMIAKMNPAEKRRDKKTVAKPKANQKTSTAIANPVSALPAEVKKVEDTANK